MAQKHRPQLVVALGAFALTAVFGLQAAQAACGKCFSTDGPDTFEEVRCYDPVSGQTVLGSAGYDIDGHGNIFIMCEDGTCQVPGPFGQITAYNDAGSVVCATTTHDDGRGSYADCDYATNWCIALVSLD